MYMQGPMCTTKQVSLTTAFVKISNQVSRRYLQFGNCAQIVTYAFVPTGQAVPTVGHTLAANAEYRADMQAPGGDLYMKAAAAATCILTE